MSRKLEQEIKRIEQRLAAEEDPIRTVLDVVHKFHDLIRQGRIAEADQYTSTRGMAIECSRIDGFTELKVEEVIASRSAAILVMAVLPEVGEDLRVLLQFKRLRQGSDFRWRLSTLSYESDARLANQIDSFMQSNPDCQIAYVDDDRQLDSPTIQIRFSTGSLAKRR